MKLCNYEEPMILVLKKCLTLRYATLFWKIHIENILKLPIQGYPLHPTSDFKYLFETYEYIKYIFVGKELTEWQCIDTNYIFQCNE